MGRRRQASPGWWRSWQSEAAANRLHGAWALTVTLASRSRTAQPHPDLLGAGAVEGRFARAGRSRRGGLRRVSAAHAFAARGLGLQPTKGWGRHRIGLSKELPCLASGP